MSGFYFDTKNTHDEAAHGDCELSENNLQVHISRASNIGTNKPIDKDKVYWETKVLGVGGSKFGWAGIVSGNRNSNASRMALRFYCFGAYGIDIHDKIFLQDADILEGDIIGITLNKLNKMAGVYINGILKKNIQLTTTEYELYPAIGCSNSGENIGITAIANFGATPFEYPVPEGYRAIETLPQKRLYLKDNAIYGIQ